MVAGVASLLIGCYLIALTSITEIQKGVHVFNHDLRPSTDGQRIFKHMTIFIYWHSKIRQLSCKSRMACQFFYLKI